MYTLVDKIFGFFGFNAVADDALPVDGKGFFQRYQERIFEDVDENELDKINNLSRYLINPFTLLGRFIPLRYESLGGYDYLLASIGLREDVMRNILKYITTLYGKKGTRIGYVSMFRMIGIDSTILIEEYSSTTGFDSSVTLDDTSRRFDGAQSTCSDYSIQLFGTMTYTTALALEIQAVIIFNEPINARLIKLTYNEIDLPIPQSGRSYNDSYNISYK